jgi:hypothetical protein
MKLLGVTQPIAIRSSVHSRIGVSPGCRCCREQNRWKLAAGSVSEILSFKLSVLQCPLLVISGRYPCRIIALSAVSMSHRIMASEALAS